MWNLSTLRSYSTSHAWYYGQGTYDTGVGNSGTLTSAPVDLTNSTNATLSFSYWREVEDYPNFAYDHTYVEVSYDGGPWTRVWQLDSTDPSGNTWKQASLPLESKMVYVRFGFDTLDSVSNNFEGWYVDDVDVSGTPASNIAPVAADDSYSTDEDAGAVVTLSATDPEECELTFTVISGPSNGSLSALTGQTCVAGPSNSDSLEVTYTPNADFNGSDSFTYKAYDGLADSNTATVSITVNPMNDAPVAADDSYSTDEDAGAVVTLSATDLEECELTFSIISGPANGTLTALTAQTCVGSLPNSDSIEVTYTPNPGFTGNDSFTYKANDGTVDSNNAMVSITVTPVNDAPVASEDGYSIDEDAVLDVATAGVLANDSDADGNPMTSVLVSDAANGVLTLNADGSFSYTPNADFNGSDSFTYKANDGLADSNTATVSITVNAVNDAPVAAADSYSIAEDTGVLVTHSATDLEECELTFSIIISGPANGTLTALTAQTCVGSLPNSDSIEVTYTPNPGFTGNDSFTYKANDGTADSNDATVTISVTATADTVHVGDLDGASTKLAKGAWSGQVTVLIYNGGEGPVADAVVTGIFTQNGDSVGPLFCITGDDGTCTIKSGTFPQKSGNATFTVLDVILPGHDYQWGDNHDPDGDSDGTAIALSK